MNEEEYEIYKNEAYTQADALLESKDFDKLDEKNDVNSIEKILFEVTTEYLKGSITLGLFSTICSQFEAAFTFHNLSQKAKDIVYSGIDLDYYSYIDVNLDEVKKLNQKISEYIK